MNSPIVLSPLGRVHVVGDGQECLSLRHSLTDSCYFRNGRSNSNMESTDFFKHCINFVKPWWKFKVMSLYVSSSCQTLSNTFSTSINIAGMVPNQIIHDSFNQLQDLLHSGVFSPEGQLKV